MDVTLHTDAIHRGAGQIMPPTRRCCFAAELTAKPTLQEPVFLVEITCPQEAMSGVYNCMNLRRGCVFEENPREGTPLVQVKAHLPVAESFYIHIYIHIYIYIYIYIYISIYIWPYGAHPDPMSNKTKI